MTSIHFAHVSFAYSTAVPVLSDVDLDLGPGWYGVVGPNGAGKSTLLGLTSGCLEPTVGSVRRVGVASCASVPQETVERPDRVSVFAGRWDGDAARLRSQLQLDPDDVPRWDRLSPGERTRWAVAAAVAEQPDLLLLDEPTNHLDAYARELLLHLLRRFEGIGLVVSHDRTLLDDLTNRTLRVHRGDVEVRTGGYTKARLQWRQEEQQLREAHERSRREERRLAEEAARLEQARNGAERGSAEARRLSRPKEHDSHSTARKFRAAKAAAAHAKRAGVASRRLERQAAATDALRVRRNRGGPVELRGTPSPRDTLLTLRADVLAAPDGSALLHDVDLHVEAEARIHVRGPNGAGKTTLLAALLATDSDVAGEAVVIPQELDDDRISDMLRRLRALDRDSLGRLLGIIANLGGEPARLLLCTDRPSPGEARKLALALALAGSAPLVVLDEPTNHLDLPAIERLEDALTGYRGAILVATHDGPFAARVTTLTWHVADGRVEVLTGGQSPADSSGWKTPMTLPSGSRR